MCIRDLAQRQVPVSPRSRVDLLARLYYIKRLLRRYSISADWKCERFAVGRFEPSATVFPFYRTTQMTDCTPQGTVHYNYNLESRCNNYSIVLDLICASPQHNFIQLPTSTQRYPNSSQTTTKATFEHTLQHQSAR